MRQHQINGECMTCLCLGLSSRLGLELTLGVWGLSSDL